MKLKRGDRYLEEFHVRMALSQYLQTMNLIHDDEEVTSVTPDTDARVYKIKVERV